MEPFCRDFGFPLGGVGKRGRGPVGGGSIEGGGWVGINKG
jgi:hypothetical protein